MRRRLRECFFVAVVFLSFSLQLCSSLFIPKRQFAFHFTAFFLCCLLQKKTLNGKVTSSNTFCILLLFVEAAINAVAATAGADAREGETAISQAENQSKKKGGQKQEEGSDQKHKHHRPSVQPDSAHAASSEQGASAAAMKHEAVRLKNEADGLELKFANTRQAPALGKRTAGDDSSSQNRLSAAQRSPADEVLAMVVSRLNAELQASRYRVKEGIENLRRDKQRREQEKKEAKEQEAKNKALTEGWLARLIVSLPQILVLPLILLCHPSLLHRLLLVYVSFCSFHSPSYCLLPSCLSFLPPLILLFSLFFHLKQHDYQQYLAFSVFTHISSFFLLARALQDRQQEEQYRMRLQQQQQDYQQYLAKVQKEEQEGRERLARKQKERREAALRRQEERNRKQREEV